MKITVFSVFVGLLASVSLAQVQLLTIVSPTSFKAGSTQTIAWTVNGDVPQKTVSIELMSGNPNALKVDAVLKTGVNPNDLTADVKIPTNVPEQNYAIRIRSDDFTITAYTAFFPVTGGVVDAKQTDTTGSKNVTSPTGGKKTGPIATANPTATVTPRSSDSGSNSLVPSIMASFAFVGVLASLFAC